MVATMWYWETYGRKKFLYKEIVVLNTEVKTGTPITKSMVAHKYYEQSTLMNNAITDGNELKEKAADQYIPANTPLASQYFTSSTVKLNSNQQILSLPAAWIASVPDSLRRGDTISICPFTGSNNQTTTGPTNTNGSTVNTYSEKQLDAIKSNAGDELVSTVVAYVKDANNKEIVDASSTNRLDGSAKIDSIEIIVTDEQMQKLKSSYESGNKFVILYKR